MSHAIGPQGKALREVAYLHSMLLPNLIAGNLHRTEGRRGCRSTQVLLAELTVEGCSHPTQSARGVLERRNNVMTFTRNVDRKHAV
eukprot:189394-Pyramimonas_sp.AAC.1